MNKSSSKLIYLDNASSSLKLDHFIKQLLDSYTDNSWIKKKEQFLHSLFLKLSQLLELNPAEINLVPSSSYGINVIWEHLLVDIKTQQLSVLISRAEHISNLTSLIQFQARMREKMKIVIEYYDLEDQDFISEEKNSQKIILLTIRDNLGLQFWTKEKIQEIKNQQPNWIFIGDFTQAVSELIAKKEMASYVKLFEYFYFSAHKFFGPFGIGVIGTPNRKCSLGINYLGNNLCSRAKIDWRSVYIWDKSFEKTISFVEKSGEKKEKLLRFWRENFPHSGFFSYINLHQSLIFLVKLNWTEGDLLTAHDFVFFLNHAGVIFRAQDLCSSHPMLRENSIIRFSLSPMNTEQELAKLFELMTSFEEIKIRKSIKI